MSELNLHQKLVEIRKAVEFLKKESQGHGFKFTSSSQVIMSVREKMNELGVLLIPEVTGHDVSDHKTQNGKNWYFTELDIKYTWVNADDPTQTISCPWYGQGLDDGEKGVGKAFTYAEKYLILKFFNIPTDKDDPDGSKPIDDKKPAASTVDGKAAKKIVEGMKASLQKTENPGQCSKWWQDNAKQITTLPKNFVEQITGEFGTQKSSFFIECKQDNPDKPKNVLKTACEVCESREGCPSW